MRRVLFLFALWVAAAPLAAHELKSVLLRLDELPDKVVQATLTTPLSRDGTAVAVVPHFQPGCTSMTEPRVERRAEQVLRQWRMQCPGGLTSRTVSFEGLDLRTPDAVVMLRYADGQQQIVTADRHDPVIQLRPATQALVPPGLIDYLPMGIRHILLGPDHLLFVLGLLLVVFVAGHGFRMLVLALTGFTLAHSLTMALAVLGIWGLPAKPVELLIALSIVLLAWEIARFRHSRESGNLEGPNTGFPLSRERQSGSLTMRKPWLVAFAFGLLHGFGFAGALAAMGLPEQARGWALLLFNVGVEIGQLLFVVAVLVAWAALRRLHRFAFPNQGVAMLATLLGGIAVYWTLDRLLPWSTTLFAGT